MYKIINSIIIALFLAFAVLIIIFLGSGRSIKQAVKRETVPREFLVDVDVIEDYRGLGYTGQRKTAVDNKRNFYIAYRKNVSGYSEIFIARVFEQNNTLKISGTDNPVTTIEKTEQRVPSIAVDSKGTVHVAWYGSDGGNNEDNNRQIKYVRSTDQGQTWSSWRNISYVSGYMAREALWQEHPSITVGKDDVLYIVWEGKDEQNKNQQIKFSKSPNGGNSWSNWKNINISQNTTQSRPSLVEDQSGKLYVFMYSSWGNANGVQQIQYATSSDKGETWSDWQAISDPQFDSRHVSVAIDAEGAIRVAWRAPTVPGGPTNIIYRSLSNGQWSSMVIVAPSSSWQFFPSVGIDGMGNAYVTWIQGGSASGFPQDDPQGEYGFVSFMKNGTFQNPTALSGQGDIFYPGVPEKTDDTKSVPVVYAEPTADNKFAVKMKFFNLPK